LNDRPIHQERQSWELKEAPDYTCDSFTQAADDEKNGPLVAPPPDLPEQYEILDLLGHGGMGTVYKARHKELGYEVAVKVINEKDNTKNENGQEEKSRQQRFLNEAKAAARLDHPNLIRLRDFGLTKSGTPYLIMDYVEGQSLAQYLNNTGKVAPNKAISLLMETIEGLEQAHKLGIVHRDIKPSNILLTISDSGALKPHILDFGIARFTEDGGTTQGLTTTGEIFGSPLYMAPEQALSSKVDARADIYALGCVFFECLTGEPPFKGETPIQTVMQHLNNKAPTLTNKLKVTLPKGLETLIQRCLEKKPEQRYQNLGTLKADLKAVQLGKAIKLGVREPRKNLVLFAALGASTILIALQLLGLTIASPGDRPPVPPITSALALAQRAYQLDMKEAYAAYQKGDYQAASVYLRGAVDAYQDALDEMVRDLTKTNTPASRAEQLAKIRNMHVLITENLQHIGDCYSKMPNLKEAAVWYEKARQSSILKDKAWLTELEEKLKLPQTEAQKKELQQQKDNALKNLADKQVKGSPEAAK
jgi:serine/threonine protein kinase